MRQAAVLITAAVTILTLTAPTTVRAQSSAFDGPQAFGVLAGTGLLAGMICWTVELANRESRYRDDAPRVVRDDDYERAGWFGGVRIGSATEFVDEGREEKSVRDAFATDVKFVMDSGNTSAGFGLVAGRRCNDRFSVEINIEWVDKFSGKIIRTDNGKVAAKVTFAPITGTVNLKGYLLTGRYQPYGLFGVGLMAIDSVTKTETLASEQTTGLVALRFGAGIDYYLTRNWVLNAELDYIYSATDIQTLDYLSLGFGVSYRF